ncbi:hypothetical protein K4K58_012455 [Colletotrichum sp. SAR11_239]|nr:hypothetical protein K4K58_012455 [Colletotrichum sp. SAR11_239]
MPDINGHFQSYNSINLKTREISFNATTNVIMERWLPNYGPIPPAPEPARPQQPVNQETPQDIPQDPTLPQRPVGADRIPDYGPNFADPDQDPEPWPEPIPEYDDRNAEELPPAPINNNDGAREEELPENHWSRQIAPAAITHVTFGMSVPPPDDDVAELLDEGYENIPYNYFKRTPHIVFNVRGEIKASIGLDTGLVGRCMISTAMVTFNFDRRQPADRAPTK